jgi:hypothetical protein
MSRQSSGFVVGILLIVVLALVGCASEAQPAGVSGSRNAGGVRPGDTNVTNLVADGDVVVGGDLTVAGECSGCGGGTTIATLNDIPTLSASKPVTLTGSVSLPAGSVTGTMVADVQRSVPLSLLGWFDCSLDPPVLVSPTSNGNNSPDVRLGDGSLGSRATMYFDADEDYQDTDSICAHLTVPADYVSGGRLRVRGGKELAAGTSGEQLEVALTSDTNGLALCTSAVFANSGIATYDITNCDPNAARTPGQGLTVGLHVILAGEGVFDDAVLLNALEFVYTASQ